MSKYHDSDPEIGCRQNLDASLTEFVVKRQKRKYNPSSPVIDTNQQEIIAMLQKMSVDIAEVKTQNAEIRQTNLEIEKSLEFVSKQYEDMRQKLESLEHVHKELLSYITSLELKIENLERNSKSTTVEIRNVPASDSETKAGLCELIERTCKALEVGVNTNDLKDVFRVSNKSGTKTIIAEFTTTFAKNSIIQGAGHITKNSLTIN